MQGPDGIGATPNGRLLTSFTSAGYVFLVMFGLTAIAWRSDSPLVSMFTPVCFLGATVCFVLGIMKTKRSFRVLAAIGLLLNVSLASYLWLS